MVVCNRIGFSTRVHEEASLVVVQMLGRQVAQQDQSLCFDVLYPIREMCYLVRTAACLRVTHPVKQDAAKNVVRRQKV